ncbi:MAG: ferrous iron transport protein A [Acidimicrobiia bacterium]|nr:ferrous iron transport protein A [Acidimicrobiia bacterium]
MPVPVAPLPSDRAPVPLSSIPAGTVVTLHEIQDPESRSLLRSLGLTQSARLKLCKIGDPCIVQVRATRIGLSRAVAQAVYVVANGTGEL